MNENFLAKLKKVRLLDLAHFLLALLIWPWAKLYKKRRPHIWLLCESGTEARDNAYYLFLYLCSEHPEIDAVYAIKHNCRDYQNVAEKGAVIPFGGWKHWLYYIAAEVNISSQKYGKPNAAVCYALEVSGLWKNTRVFLQHGVIKDDLPFLHYEKTKMRLFSCAALPEYCFVRDTFGYPQGYVQYLGLCRFDALQHAQADPNLILIAPTWRSYLYTPAQKARRWDSFLETDYFKCWDQLLRSPELISLLHQYNKRVVFCPHRNMQFCAQAFTSADPSVCVLGWAEADITQLIHESALLITDYSSIFMDFAYMKRPALYYQFDYADYRAGHLPEGYFDYQRDAFGPVCADLPELLAQLQRLLENGCRMEEPYLQRQARFYTLWDDRNCQRTYHAIQEVCSRETAGIPY